MYSFHLLPQETNRHVGSYHTRDLFAIPDEPGRADRSFAFRRPETLATAIEAEVEEYIAGRVHITNERGHRQVVRNGYLPQRMIQTGIGPVEVRQPRVHDRRPEGEREEFTSKILPPYLRKTKSLEELVPWLYLKGVSTGDFNEALAALVGPNCPGLSATTVTRLAEPRCEKTIENAAQQNGEFTLTQ